MRSTLGWVSSLQRRRNHARTLHTSLQLRRAHDSALLHPGRPTELLHGCWLVAAGMVVVAAGAASVAGGGRGLQ